MKKHTLIGGLVLSFMTLLSCGGSDDGGDGGGGSTETAPWLNDGGAWGSVIDYPNGRNGIHLTMKTTNEGLYVESLDGDTNYIDRLQFGGPSPEWSEWAFGDGINGYYPVKENSEQPSEFAIYFYNIHQHGFISMNSDVPAELLEDIPYEIGQWNPADIMAVDNSEQAYTWAFWGSEVRVKGADQSYETIATLPTDGVNFVEPDPDSAVMWVTSGSRLFRLTVNGDYDEYDVSAYHNPDIFLSSIEKVRFSGDDVYFRCQNNVFRIKGGTLSLFYEIDNGANFMGGDFAVDNHYMYATDGVRKQLSNGSESHIVPDMPNTTDQEVLMEYFTNTSAFASGQIETSKNATSGYLYILANDKILIVPKSL